MARMKKIPRRIKEVFPQNHNPNNWLLESESDFYALVRHKTLPVGMRFDKFSKAVV